MSLTAEEFDNYPFEEDKRYELDKGELIDDQTSMQGTQTSPFSITNQRGGGATMIVRFTGALVGCLALCSFADSLATYRGHYVNKDYGFQVTIPSGYVGRGAALSAPNHGFIVETREGSTVAVDAIYDTVVGPSGEGLEQQMIRSNGPPMAKLGELKAWTSAKTRIEGERHVLHRGIVAYRVSQQGDAIIYSISEETQEEQHEAADRVFQEIVKSFRVISINSKQ